jgi:hypothetical protein
VIYLEKTIEEIGLWWFIRVVAMEETRYGN